MSNFNTSEFKSGIIAGCTRAIISQPFDTVKTHMQCGNYPSSLNCAKILMKNEGIGFFFKGIAFPLMGNSFIVGTHFHVYNTYKNTFSPCHAGGLAGLCASFLANPVELVRIKMQMSAKNANNKNYKNSFVCLQNIINHNGVRGIFKGQLSTSFRDAIGYSGFFWMYANYQFIHNKIFSPEYYYKYELLNKMVKGTLCGFMLWGSMYPIDVIKTTTQSRLLELSKVSYLQTIQHIYSVNKLAGFYKGFGLTMFRAIPVNIGIVLAVDYFC